MEVNVYLPAHVGREVWDMVDRDDGMLDRDDGMLDRDEGKMYQVDHGYLSHSHRRKR